MTCDYIGGAFDSKAFDLSFNIGVLTCRALLFEPHEHRLSPLSLASGAQSLAGADQIILYASSIQARPLSFNSTVIMLASSALATVADRYQK